MASITLDHVAVMVSDLEKSLHFYRDLLGFDVLSPEEHQGGPIDEGGIREKNAMCPWHGWEFDVTTGKCTFNDTIRIPTFKVKEEGGEVYVEG